MGKKKSKPPPAPDYAAIARQQSADQNALLDKQTTANRVNQEGPMGSLTWSQDGAGNWTQKTTLNDQQQQALMQEIDHNGLKDLLRPLRR